MAMACLLKIALGKGQGKSLSNAGARRWPQRDGMVLADSSGVGLEERFGPLKNPLTAMGGPREDP
jgi:hypothetical protein